MIMMYDVDCIYPSIEQNGTLGIFDIVLRHDLNAILSTVVYTPPTAIAVSEDYQIFFSPTF